MIMPETFTLENIKRMQSECKEKDAFNYAVTAIEILNS